MKNFGRTALAIAVVILLLGATSAFATPVAPFNSSLNMGNSDLTGVSSGPYGSVQVVLNSSNSATITFTALGGYLFIDTGLAGVNLNATSWTVGGLSFTQLSGFTAPTINTDGAKNEDGFGSFNQTFKTDSGYASGVTSFTFTVTDIGATWADAASVLIANANGFDAAAHVAICNNTPCTVAGGANVTGFAGEGNGTITNTPEPSSLLLLGTGLSILSGYGLRRRSTSAG
jgi:hypothetical protein